MMMGYGGFGGFGGMGALGGFGMVLGLLFWIVLIAVAVWGLTALIAPRRSHGNRDDTPLEILRRRYARGELSDAEYEQARQPLA